MVRDKRYVYLYPDVYCCLKMYNQRERLKCIAFADLRDTFKYCELNCPKSMTCEGILL